MVTEQLILFCTSCKTITQHLRQRPNHLLHFLISVFTIIWFFVWIAITITRRRKAKCIQCGSLNSLIVDSNTARNIDRDTNNSQVVPVSGNEIPQHPVGQIMTIDEQDFGIIDLGTDLSSELRSEIDKNILTHGEPFTSGGVLGPACLPVLGAGSTVVSSLFAGNLFLATANPATLMKIGEGLSTAVVGPTGKIIAQAPFIPAGGAIIPVVAPVMFFMTVSSMMMSIRFDQIQASLDHLATAVEQLIVREVAGDYGIIRSAMERLRDISAEFEESRRFTQEMRIRMALVEKDVNILRHKYDILSTRSVDAVLGADLAVSDINLFTICSLADIQVDRLRLKLALQENPDDVSRSFKTLVLKTDLYRRSFTDLLENDSVKEYENKLKDSVNKMNWWARNISARKKHDDKVADIEAVGNIRDGSYDDLRLNLARWSDDLTLGKDSGREQSVVYFRENYGKGELKAHYTSDWQLV